jgi:CRP-like cAMP-binding protein
MGLLQGRVGCWGSSPWSGPILGHVAIPGDWFGQGPAQLGIERSMSFRALEASTLLYLPAYRMQQMAAATPELHAQFAKLSETSAQLMVGLIADALTPGAERRMAAALLKAARSELDSGRLAQAPLPLGQASLSELTCVSRAHVNRILRRWTAKGLVKPGYKHIRLLSLEGLRSIARGTDE